MSDPAPFAVRDRVEKVGGDYRYEGEVVAAFRKRSGVVRYVVEDDRGLLFIFSQANLRACHPPRDPGAGPGGGAEG
jgi:hypothetical protein